MPILIKGMEMPDSCHVCVAGYGGCCYVAPPEEDGICPDHGRAGWCPLVPVPPHGRLIDADAAVVAIQNSIETVHDGMQKILLDYAQKMFNATPTIIPAEGEE